MGTADFADTVIHAWVADLLTNPTWGVIRYAKLTTIKAIFDIAELHRKAATGDMPSIADWDAAIRAARAAAQAMNPASNPAGLSAIRAVYRSTAIIDTHHQATVVTGNALRAHALATVGTAATRLVEFTRHAIQTWRRLGGLDQTGDIDPTSVDNTVQLIAVPA